MKSIYLDYNATTPIPPEVADAMIPFLREHFGNPSSSHPYGIATKQAIENARQQVAGLIQCSPEEIVFTSGGTESNNYAIRGSVLARRDQGNHIITSAVEHPAVLEVCQWLQSQGFRLTILPVDSNGMVNPQDLENAMTPGTLLVSIMHANNEVGTIQPIVELARIAHRYGALMHTDAAQSTGKIPVNIAELDVDLLSIAGHKLYAPKGIGALYIRSGIKLDKLMLVAPVSRNRDIPEAKTFFPYPIAKDLKASEIIMAASTNDPYMSVEEAIELQSKLNIGMKIMENAGHINAASGFGKLDCALDWIKRVDECEINEDVNKERVKS